MKVPRRETAEVIVDTQNESVDSIIPETSNEVKDEEVIVSSTQSNVTSNKGQKNEPLLTVRLNRYHTCYVGGTYYVFEKNRVYQVPSDVKRVLSIAGLLAPL